MERFGNRPKNRTTNENLANSAKHRIGTRLTNARHWIKYVKIAERKETLPEYADKKKITDAKYKM